MLWSCATLCGSNGATGIDASLLPVFSQIATFFSNNLDFFTSAGYSPRGSTATLNPLQAESMLAYKKKAAAYIHAVKQVGRHLVTLLLSRSDDVPFSLQRN